MRSLTGRDVMISLTLWFTRDRLGICTCCQTLNWRIVTITVLGAQETYCRDCYIRMYPDELACRDFPRPRDGLWGVGPEFQLAHLVSVRVFKDQLATPLLRPFWGLTDDELASFRRISRAIKEGFSCPST